LPEAGNAAGEVAEEIELVAIVCAEVGVDVPDENSVDRAEARFGFG